MINFKQKMKGQGTLDTIDSHGLSKLRQLF